MPVAKRTGGDAPVDGTPDRIRPYLFHGLDLTVHGGQAVGDCPFCGKEGKFSAEVATGLWRCWSCGTGNDAGGGNTLTFIRCLYDAACRAATPAFYATVAADRRLAAPGTAAAWGVAPAPTHAGEWLLPGYAPDGKLWQLYRRCYLDGGMRLLPTPGLGHGPGREHGLHYARAEWDPAERRPSVVVCEGPWDGMALWEACQAGEFGDADIMAVPGCNVWRDEWTEMCIGREVVLLYDNDHPRENNGRVSRAGYDGMARTARRLASAAADIKYLRWGSEGYDPGLPDGWDVRDALATAPNRREAVAGILSRLEPVPADWVLGPAIGGGGHRRGTEALDCDKWADCEAAWEDALHWRRDMSDGLAVLLAICASTAQSGNQLFLQLIGSAGSGKTTMCDGLLVSHHCHHLEHLTGFHSGFKKPGDGKKDCSLIARINNKTLVTPEADVLITSPAFHRIMGEQRRIFDGKSAATYKNNDEDTIYEGLRTPWIMAGTPAMMDHDQSHLGDRFLRFIIADPREDEKRAILRSALQSERTAMIDRTNGTAGSLVDPKTRRAHGMTGGYVDWLRANVEDQIAMVDIGRAAEERCIDLAEISADLRARPNEDKRKLETHDCKELPTRLARQYVRLAAHLAVVLNKKRVDRDVLRIVRKVALDTAYGHSLNIVRWLCGPHHRLEGETYQSVGGIGAKTLQVWLNMTEERVNRYLLFLRKIGVVEYAEAPHVGGLWLLTARTHDLYNRIMRD